jgi:hypothetical protein
LYARYREKRQEFLRKQGRISEYDSENLMYGLICKVLSEEQFTKFDLAVHVSLKTLFRDTKRLNTDEKRYIQNSLTHVDFLIFDKFGKIPRLAVEVNGAAFHTKGTRQTERDKLKNTILEKYDLPYIRFKTNGSSEYDKLVVALNDVMGVSYAHNEIFMQQEGERKL